MVVAETARGAGVQLIKLPVAHTFMMNDRRVQAIVCAARPGSSARLLEVQRYTSATVGDDAAVRVGLHLPLLAADGVRLVTDEALCRRAAAAYRRLTDGHYVKTLSGRVYVIEAGERYVVLDPDWRYNPAQPDVVTIRVFDEGFRELAHY